jgi:hypothetical protein
MRHTSTVICVLGLLATACQPSQAPVSQEREAAIREEIIRQYNELAEQWIAAYQPGWQGEQQEVQQGAEVITDAWYRTPDSLIDHSHSWRSVESVEWTNLHVDVLAPNVAYVIGKFEFNATDQAGEVGTYRGQRKSVWLERDGKWEELLGTG